MARHLDAIALQMRAVQDVARADEAGNEARSRAVVHVFGCSDLLDPPAVHDHDAIGHGHRFNLVVGDVDRGVAILVVKTPDLEAHLAAQVGIAVGQRLVEQEDVWIGRKGARERDALLLPAGQLAGIAVRLLGEARRAQQGFRPRLALCRRHRLHLQAVSDVLAHGHVRPDSVALGDHAHVAAFGLDNRLRRRNHIAPDADFTRVGRQKTREHAQSGRLAASRGSEQADELAAFDFEVDRVDRRQRAVTLGRPQSSR